MTKECECFAHSASECVCGAWDEPQRKWVGLDNDDLVWIYSNSDKVGQFISNTEAKLKEKNSL